MCTFSRHFFAFPLFTLKKNGKIVVILIYYFLMLLSAAGHLIQFHNFIQIVSLLLSFFFIIGFDDAEEKVTQWQGNGAFSKTLTHIDCEGTPFFYVLYSVQCRLYRLITWEQRASERMKWVREWNECMCDDGMPYIWIHKSRAKIMLSTRRAATTTNPLDFKSLVGLFHSAI